jgi:serpin B
MLRIVIAAFVLLLVANPAQPSRAAEKEGAPKASKELQAIAKSNNRFAFDLYGRLRTNDGNLFFSPTSISTALAMTYAGAEGGTEKEMATVLRFTLPEAEVHQAFASLMATLNAPKKDTYELRMANRLWGQTGYGFLPEFLGTTSKQYGAELAQVDFVNKAEKSRQEINAWVERQTNNKIMDLLPPNSVSDLTRLVLTNAIYFKGKWRHEFDKKATKNAPFTMSATEKVDVPLMFQKQRFKYGEMGELQLLEMGYKGDDLSMLVLLPKKVDGLQRLEKELTADNLDKWSSAMLMREVQTYLPRFKLTEQFQLNSMLAGMGMPSAFDPGKADFSGMNGKRDLFISAAVHKAFVDVNEEGTEAAAATGVVVGVTSLPPPPKVFRADHPFVFMIRENRTGSILFMGRVTNPKR